VSRRVRLRRTLAGLVLLALVVTVTVRLVSREDAVGAAAAAADRLPGVRVSASAAASPTPSSPSSSPSSVTPTQDGQDGSTTTAPSRTGAVKVPQNGSGKVRVVSVPGPQSMASGRTVRYTVEIEQGLGVDEAEVVRTIKSVLLDERGWQKEDAVRFVNVSPAQEQAGTHVDIRITLASPGLTDRLCAPLRTLSQVSCWNGGRSVLNLRRWQLGDDSYGADVDRYRIYQVNHEVGHGLGHQHASCPAKGKRAPVMVQQTLSLQGCKAWPYPTGA
jgi:hypothetical protein